VIFDFGFLIFDLGPDCVFFYRPNSGPIYYWRSAGEIFHRAERFFHFFCGSGGFFIFEKPASWVETRIQTAEHRT